MEKLQILDSIVPEYAEKFTKGQYGLEEMPLLDALCEQFQKLPLPDMQKVYIIACQHLLQPQVVMFRWFIALGIPAGNIWVLPKIYSANQLIAEELINTGCFVATEALKFSTQQSFDDFHLLQCNAMVQKALAEIPAGSKVIVLDDGGGLLVSFAKKYDSKTPFKIYGVEQTASGKNIVLNNVLPYLVTSVASSIEKIEIETGYIIRHSVKRVFEYFDAEKVTKDAKILVLGKGPIGRTLIDSLTEHGFYCVGYDVKEKKPKPALLDFDVIIGATGKMSVSVGDLLELKQGCHLISVSSSDREFPSVHIRTHSISGSNIHDTFVSSINGIRLANGGFPITFKAERFECYPLEIDVTMMKLAQGVLNHITCKTDTDDSIQEIKIQKLNPWTRKNLYAWSVVIAGLALTQLVFHIQIVVPSSTKAYILSAALSLWGALPGILYLRHYHKLAKLAPE